MILDEMNPETRHIAFFDEEDDSVHIFCEWCHPDGDVSFCGMDISESDLVDDDSPDDDDCVFCAGFTLCPECDAKLEDMFS